MEIPDQVNSIISSKRFVDAPFNATPVAPLWTYSREFAERVVHHIIAGKSLSKISKLDGYPSYETICYWRANNVDFDNAIKKAKQCRAEIYRDLIEDSIIEDLELAPEQIAAAKLKYDKLKYLASVDDPTTFGKQSAGGGDTNVQVIIDTGINR